MSAETDLIPNYAFYEWLADRCDAVFSKVGGYSASGLENLRPVEGSAFLLAASHRAAIDPFVAGLVMHYLDRFTEDLPDGPIKSRPMSYVAKSQLFLPGVKQVIEACGAIEVKRDGKGYTPEALERIGNIFNANGVLLAFVEGTRNPQDIWEVKREKMKNGTSRLALEFGVPIVPAGIAGRHKLTKLPRHIHFGPPIFTEPSTEPDPELQRAEVLAKTDEIHAAVNECHQIAVASYLGQRLMLQEAV